MSDTNPRPSYFSQIRVDPNNDLKIWLGGVNIYMSEDGGKTFVQTRFARVHSDVHAIWIDPANSDHLVIGNDGGVWVTDDSGRAWRHIEQHRAGPVLRSRVRLSEAVSRLRRACRTTTPGAVPVPPTQTARHRQRRLDHGAGRRRILQPHRPQRPEHHLRRIAGRQSFAARSEDQRIANPSGRRKMNDQAPRYRFQWNSPLMISPHDPKTIYYGGNHLFKSTDRGDNWERLGEDLTTGADRNKLADPGQDGGSSTRFRATTAWQSWPCITAIAESPVKAGVLWVGHRRRQCADVARRRQDVDERGRARHAVFRKAATSAASSRRTRTPARLTSPSTITARRLRHLHLQDHQLRRFLHADHQRNPAGRRHGSRDSRGSGEPEPALRRHRIRPVRYLRSRRELARA